VPEVGACAAHYSVNTLQLHKFFQEASYLNDYPASFCINITLDK